MFPVTGADPEDFIRVSDLFIDESIILSEHKRIEEDIPMLVIRVSYWY